ncbi:acyltransferase [bacterium]|jgi:acetyltransferase-like isoleucine patch superfamily enzyme|nr:acyltransferase [bacterium]
MEVERSPTDEPRPTTRGLRWLVRRLSIGARHGMALLRARILGLIPGLFFNRVGRGTRFWGWPRLQYLGGHITIGDRCALGKNIFFLVGPEGRIEIGDNVSMNDYCYVTALQGISIGEGTAIGEFVSIRDYDHRFDGIRSPKEQGFIYAPIKIGRNVWIGRGAIITRGVTIGDGAVIGANSAVTRDIPPRCLAVGTPARMIRDLGKEETESSH